MSDKTHDFITRVEWEPENDKPDLMGNAIDEIVTGPLDYVHIERMHDGCYWMALGKGGARQIVVILSESEQSKIVARTEAD